MGGVCLGERKLVPSRKVLDRDGRRVRPWIMRQRTCIVPGWDLEARLLTRDSKEKPIIIDNRY